MIFTHTGKFGDFLYTLPIADKFFKDTGEKIIWVLPEDFGPFQSVGDLLILQPFTEKTILVPFKVTNYGMGGQPFNLNPSDYGIIGNYINFGFHHYPDMFITDCYSKWSGLPNDKNNFVLNLPDKITVEEKVGTDDHMNSFYPNAFHIKSEMGLCWNISRLLSTLERHFLFSGMAVVFYFAKYFNFNLHKWAGHPPTSFYFEDTARFNLITHA
jgi:hypothetical protein